MTHCSRLDCQVGCWTARRGRKAKPGQRFAWLRRWGWWLNSWRAVGRQALCASRWLMTGLHCGTIVHIIGDEQRTYLVVKGTDRNRALRLSRANGWHGDSEILMLCNSRISVLIRIKEELHSTRLYYVQACRVLGSNLPILFGFQDHLRIEIKSNTACPTTNVFSCYSSRWLL